MLYNAIFIIKAVIRTFTGIAVNKVIYFVLINIDKADIVFVIIIVNIVYAGFTVIHSIVSFYITINIVPAPIRTQPINDLTVNSSCRKAKASINVIITDNLSIGTTFDTSPACIAL